MFAWLAGHAGLVPDFLFGPLDALRRPDYHVPPHDQSEMLVNLSARIIGFSFALASAKYYENLIAGVTPLFAAQISARGIRWLALVAEFSSRLLMSWWWMPLILVATLVDARWWPICSAIGMTSVLVANASWALFCQRIVSEAHKDDKKPVGVLPRAIEQVTGLDGFIRWPASMFVYCSVVWTVGLLLEFKVLQDMIVYASCVAVVNIVLFYILRCGRQAAVVRTGLTRIVLAAERLAVRLPTHQRVGSLAPGYAASSTDSPTGT
jgi:hypothetical protein